MKTHCYILLLSLAFLLPAFSLGQDTEPQPKAAHPFQISVQLVRGLAIRQGMFVLAETEHIQMFTGAMFRYVPNRWGLRGGFEFGRHRSVYPSDNDCVDCPDGSGHGAEAMLKVGGQKLLGRTQKWLYSFLDLYARHYSGMFTFDAEYEGTHRTFWGGGFDYGLGGNFRLFRQLYLNPEPYVGLYAGKMRYGRNPGGFVTSPDWSPWFTDLNVYLGLLLNLMVAF